MHFFKDYSKDLLKYLPSSILPAIVSLVSVPIFTSYLKPDEWGNYVLVLNAAELLSTISITWMTTSVVRFYELSLREGKYSRFITTVLISGLLSVFSLVGLAFLISFVFKEQLPKEFLVSVTATGLWLFAGTALGNLVGSVFKAKREAGKYSILVSWQSISRLGFGILFVGLLGWGFEGLLFGSALGLTVGLIAFSYSLFSKSFHFKYFSWTLSKSLLFYGLPIAIGDLSYWLLRLADRYIIRLSRSAYEVGIYSVGYDISDKTFGTLIALLSLAAWPLVVQTWERKGEQVTSEFISQLLRMYLLLAIPAVVAMSLLREPLITVLADKLYIDGNQIIPLVVSSVFFFGFQRWFQLVLLLHKKTGFVMISVLSGAVVNVILNLIFVPYFGYQASALINLLSYMLFALLIILFSRRLMKLNFPFISSFKSLLSSALMAGSIIAILSINLPEWVKLTICVPVGLIIYAIGLFVLQELSFASALNFVRSWFQRSS
jgi:O-antigen/teichoic acid export membrane protein